MSLRRRATPLLATAVVAGLAALPSGAARADLQSRIDASRSKDHRLQGAIGNDSAQIAGMQGRIDDLRTRLRGLQASLDAEQAELTTLQSQLREARSRLASLRRQFVDDRQALADQLRSQYENPHPDLVGVVLSARGFAELLETARSLHALAQHNAAITDRVHSERDQMVGTTHHLSDLESRQARVTKAAKLQRDEVADAKREIVDRELQYIRARARKRGELASVRTTRAKLQKKLDAQLAKEFAGIPGAGTGGQYGFFPAPGTNYKVNDEPELAHRLGTMGQTLHLHLIGISGYRTPQHSVEVGGFANDPHTKGMASDTPGVEGVPEGTLNHFGLTRPFPGAAEADHIQLEGSA